MRELKLWYVASALVAGLVLLAGCSAGQEGAVSQESGSSRTSSSLAESSTNNSAAQDGRGPGNTTWYFVAPAATTDEPLPADLGEILTSLAANSDTTLTIIDPDEAGGWNAAVATAVAAQPQLVIGATPGAQEEFSYTAAENLGQQFLLIDAQPPEPTENLTTLLFDQAGCPAGATCVTYADIFDPQILAENAVFDLTGAVEGALSQAIERPGTILLSTIRPRG